MNHPAEFAGKRGHDRRPSWGSVHNAVSTSHSFLDISPTVFAIDHADVTVVIGSMSRIVP